MHIKRTLLLSFFLTLCCISKLSGMAYIAFQTAMQAHMNTGENPEKLPRLYNVYAQLNQSDKALARRCAATNGYSIDDFNKTLVKQTINSSSRHKFRSVPGSSSTVEKKMEKAEPECTLDAFFKILEKRPCANELCYLFKQLSSDDQAIAIHYIIKAGYSFDEKEQAIIKLEQVPHSSPSSGYVNTFGYEKEERMEGANPQWTLEEFYNYVQHQRPPASSLYEAFTMLSPQDQTVAILYATDAGYSFDVEKHCFIQGSSSSSSQHRTVKSRVNEKEEKREQPKPEYTVAGFLAFVEQTKKSDGKDRTREIVTYHNNLSEKDKKKLIKLNAQRALAELAYANTYQRDALDEAGNSSSSSTSAQLKKSSSPSNLNTDYTVDGFLALLGKTNDSLESRKSLIDYYNELRSSEQQEVEVFVLAQLNMTMQEYIIDFKRWQPSKKPNPMTGYSYSSARNNYARANSLSGRCEDDWQHVEPGTSYYHIPPSCSSSSSSRSSAQTYDLKLTPEQLECFTIEQLIESFQIVPTKNSFFNIIGKYEALPLNLQKANRDKIFLILEQIGKLPEPEITKGERDMFINMYKARLEGILLNEYKEEIETLKSRVAMIEEERDRAQDHASFYEHSAYLQRKRQRERGGSI